MATTSLVLLAGFAAACGTSGTAVSTSTINSTSTTIHQVKVSPAIGSVIATAIPIGDGHVSSIPEVGYVDSCVANFSSAAGGAMAAGAWINNTTKTWDSLTKPNVLGAVSWPQASFTVTVSGGSRIITGNDLPIDHTTGIFPTRTTDPAYAYDRNPNTIAAQSISWSLALNPIAAVEPNCIGLGPIGVLDDGVYLFNALDGEGRDAGAHELLDSCEDHPESRGVLHHHDVPSCMLSKAIGASTLVGFASDGYGIYVERSAAGSLLTNSDLDVCHGRTSPVLWNGTMQNAYHYDATLEYPYTVSCFHGTPISRGKE